MIRSTSTNFTKALIDHPSHFDNVTIIVPDSWIENRTCMSLVTTNTWWLDGTPPALPWARTHRADIRITPDNAVFRSFPYSLQYGGCQEPGLAINVPSTIYSSTTESIGDYLIILIKVFINLMIKMVCECRDENGEGMGALPLRCV